VVPVDSGVDNDTQRGGQSRTLAVSWEWCSVLYWEIKHHPGCTVDSVWTTNDSLLYCGLDDVDKQRVVLGIGDEEAGTSGTPRGRTCLVEYRMTKTISRMYWDDREARTCLG
jgi:hypothetical protein